MIYRQLKNKIRLSSGDFNHILNPEIDRQFQVRHNYSETRTTEESLLRNTQLKLIDAYRCFEPQAINFTNHNQLNNRRIDRFHLSERLENNSFLSKRTTLLDQPMNKSPSFLNLPTNQSLTWEKRFMIKDYHIENPTFISNILNSNPRDWAHLRQIIKRLTKNDSPKYQGQQHSQQTRLTIYVSAITGNQNQKAHLPNNKRCPW